MLATYNILFVYLGKKIMLERSLREGMQQPKIGISRPTNLPNLIKDGQANGQKLSFDSVYQSQCGHLSSQTPAPLLPPPNQRQLPWQRSCVVTMATHVCRYHGYPDVMPGAR